MKSDSRTCESRDILSSRWRVFILYLLPAIAIVVVGPLDISSGWRAVVWTVALATMGMACIVNALRCGRVHCFLTGPFLLPDGPRRIIVRSRHAASRREWLEPARTNYSGRRHRPVVPARDFFGKISKEPSGYWQRSLSHSFRFASYPTTI
jgi:hypothetical protein